MKFGYTIVYVEDVRASIDFFCQAFGFSCRFVDDSGTYGELETGETTMAFASHSLGDDNFPAGYVKANESKNPLGMEVGFVTSDVAGAHQRAIFILKRSANAAGAQELSPPTQKPWGQVVSYVRCPDGTLVELCSPIGGDAAIG
jgi:lactoylglutathione lyase